MTINIALRQHVMSASFALVLGSTHIAALVRIDTELRRNKSLVEVMRDKDPDKWREARGGPHGRAFSHNATGMSGLIRRGLVTHLHQPHSGEPFDKWGNRRPDEIWEITEAGRLVIGLLRESGLWAEYGGEDEPAQPELIGAAS